MRHGSGFATRWATSRSNCPTASSGRSSTATSATWRSLRIAITGEGFSQREMKDVAEDFRKKLYQLRAESPRLTFWASRTSGFGWSSIPRKLAAVGVQVNALIKDLQGQNVVLPSGNINADGTRLLLETSGDFPSVRAIETMLTRVGTTDSLVRLADLVTVRRGYISPKVKPIYFNGRPAVVLSVIMQPDQDVTQLGEKLRAAARDYEARLPIGYAIDFSTYQAEQVSASVNSALSSVAQTFIVVAVLVVVFLGLRAGMVAAMIVPFAVMFSLIGMRALGIALEQVSIAAIIIALGLLVDNGVVIVEDIVSRIGRGMPAQDAGLAAGEQYALPLLISSITTVAAFLPLFLLSGASGEYAFSLAAVVALTLGGSWIAALYILPALTVWFIGRWGRPSGRRCGSLAGASVSMPPHCVSASEFSPVVLGGLHRRWSLLALTLFGRLPKQMFPLSERNQFLIYMNMPDGTDISQTEARALEISQMAGRHGGQSRNRQPDPLRGGRRPKVLSDLDAGCAGSSLRLLPGQREGLRGRGAGGRSRMEVSLRQSSGSPFQDQAARHGVGGIRHRRCGNLGSRCRPSACARRTCAITVPGRARHPRQ